jgi:hypothetical protein
MKLCYFNALLLDDTSMLGHCSALQAAKQLNVAFRTNNTVEKFTKIQPEPNIYNSSVVYQLGLLVD